MRSLGQSMPHALAQPRAQFLNKLTIVGNSVRDDAAGVFGSVIRRTICSGGTHRETCFEAGQRDMFWGRQGDTEWVAAFDAMNSAYAVAHNGAEVWLVCSTLLDEDKLCVALFAAGDYCFHSTHCTGRQGARCQ